MDDGTPGPSSAMFSSNGVSPFNRADALSSIGQRDRVYTTVQSTNNATNKRNNNNNSDGGVVNCNQATLHRPLYTARSGAECGIEPVFRPAIAPVQSIDSSTAKGRRQRAGSLGAPLRNRAAKRSPLCTNLRAAPGHFYFLLTFCVCVCVRAQVNVLLLQW